MVVQKWRMPVAGSGLPYDPAKPKYPVGLNESRGPNYPWEYQADGSMFVYVDGLDAPPFADEPDVEYMGTSEGPGQPFLIAAPVPQ